MLIKSVFIYTSFLFLVQVIERPLLSYFMACNVNKKGSLGILFTEYTAMDWWIYNNMGYIAMLCFGIHSHGHSELPPLTTTLAGRE